MIIQIEPWIDDDELFQLKRVIENKYVTENELTKEFENSIKDLTGSKYVIAVANGTLATFSIIKSLDIGPGDEVIVPNITFISSANSVILSGAKPVLADIKEDTFCLNFENLEKLVSNRTKAIMPVHLYGQSADMEKCIEFSKKYNLKIIEDAAQGVGVSFNKKHVGTYGDAGILSFYGNKIITCGEGGIILTNDNNIAKKTYALKNHGRQKKGVFVHDEIGYNFAFTEMQAAVGIAQMNKLNRIKNKKKDIHLRYSNQLNDTLGIDNCYIDKRTDPLYWFTSFLFHDCDRLQKYLFEKKIQTRRFFYPLNRQPCFIKNKDKIGNINGNFPISEKIYKWGLSLPSSYQITEEQIDEVCENIKNFYTNKNI